MGARWSWPSLLGAGDARFFAKRKRETDDGADWKWLLWESDVARAKIHPELGAGWTAVLKEACCVKAGVHKDKVNRVREDGDRGSLRLSPTNTKGNCGNSSRSRRMPGMWGVNVCKTTKKCFLRREIFISGYLEPLSLTY